MRKPSKSRKKQQRKRRAERSVRIADVITPQLNTTGSGRACGSCTACCTTMSIPELQKPPGVPCQHICERGCEIYDTRPASCRDWSCLWLTGDLPEPLKPDTCGVIWDNTYHNLFDQKLLAAREVRPGAHSEDANQAWLAETISRSLVLVITHDGQTHVLGPEDEVKTLETLVKRKAEQQGRRIDIEHGVRKDTKPE